MLRLTVASVLMTTLCCVALYGMAFADSAPMNDTYNTAFHVWDVCGRGDCKPNCDPCKPKCDPCKPKCDPCCPGPKHPYEECWTGSGLMCDTGCCGVALPCKRVCQDCETICKKIETKDPCTGCVSVEYVYETVCTEIVRPTVIPWWFQVSEGLPAENIYIDK